MTRSTILLSIIILVIAVLLFRHYLKDYDYSFFPGKAIQLAFVKTLLMLALLFLLFWGADWLFALWMPLGYLRSVLAFLIPSLLFDLLAKPLSDGYDRLIGL